MQPAPRWTTEQLTAEAYRAREIFRAERLREPLEKWKEIFDQKANEFRELLDTHGVADPRSNDMRTFIESTRP